MRRKLIIALLALPLAILAAFAVFVVYGDHRERVERWASRALDRRLTIAGRFETDFGLTTRILAEDVSLAAPDWSGEPAMIHVDRLEGSLDTRSLLRGPVRVQDLKLRGARIVLEQDAHGRTNWSFGSASRDRPSEQEPDLGVVFEHAELFDIELVFRDATRPNPLDIAVDSLRLTTDAERMLDLRVSGRVNDMPAEVAGRLGTFDNLVTGGAVEHELTGSIDEIEFTLIGRIAELARLGTPELELNVSGPDLSRVTERLGLPAAPPGAFRALAPE